MSSGSSLRGTVPAVVRNRTVKGKRETFWRSTSAGVSLTAVVITMATAMGAGLLIDHLWLTAQRDLLKSASGAAAIAATMQLRAFPPDVEDAAVLASLQTTAERFVALNLDDTLSNEERGKLSVTVAMDRPRGRVAVSAEAPLGRTLFGPFHGYFGLSSIRADSGANYDWTALWAVLALDVSRTMSRTLDDRWTRTPAEQRIGVVRAAAKEFVASVEPNPDIPVAVGVVPWAWSVGHVVEPSTTSATLDAALDRLVATGGASASSRGLKRSREILDEAPPGARRVIVLLTDGDDNRSVTGGSCGASRDECPKFRKAECDGAKADGVELFVVAATANTTDPVARQLRECASSGEFAFINHRSAESMRATFETIGGAMRPVRRSY